MHSGPELQVQAAAVGLAAAHLLSVDPKKRTASLRMGSSTFEARIDDSVSTRVLETALARGERVITQQEDGAWVILGALRTTPTPGVDEGEEFLIKAKRVELAAEHELSLKSGMASLVVRAHGYVETLAHDITTRASGIHKIVGRIIRLN